MRIIRLELLPVTCGTCSQDKLPSEFYVLNARGTLTQSCKDCLAIEPSEPTDLYPGGVKSCSVDNAVLPLSAFYVKIKATGRRFPWCIQHHAERQKSYSDEHKEEAGKRTRAWQAKNPDKVSRYQAKYRAENGDKVRERERIASQKPERKAKRAKYRTKNREKRVEYDRKYYAIPANREHKNEQSREHYNADRESILEEQRAKRLDNPEPFRAAVRKYKHNNPDKVNALTHKRRSNIAGGGGSHTAAERRAMEARYGWLCIQCGGKLPLCFDHVNPIDPPFYGSSDISNGQPLCRPHNNAKKNRVLDLRPGSIYDLRPDLPIGEVDLAMADLPVPEWVFHPKWGRLEGRTEKLCSGPLHDKPEMLPIEAFPIRSKKTGKNDLTAYCRDCKNEKQKRDRAVKKASAPKTEPKPRKPIQHKILTERVCHGITHGTEGLLLPIENFPIRSLKSGDLNRRTAYCQPCILTKQKRDRAKKKALRQPKATKPVPAPKTPKPPVDSLPEKYCNGCKKSQPIEKFGFQNKTTGQRKGICRACQKIKDSKRSNKREDIL